MGKQDPSLHALTLAASPAQVRMDLWNRLLEMAERLAAAVEQGADTATKVEQALELLDTLAAFERFWLFPGPGALATLRAKLERGDVEEFAARLRAVVHDTGDLGDRAALVAAGVVGPDDPRPCFTVVVAADYGHDDEQRILVELASLIGQPTDDFVYGVLFAPSVEDALAAVAINEEVQACVIRRELPIRSRIARGLIGELDGLLGEIEAAASGDDEDTPSVGVLTAQVVRMLRPHIDVYLATSESVIERSAGHEHVARVFYEGDSLTEQHLTVLAGVRARYATPFFDALRRYAAEPVGNFHALPIARGNSIFGSRWIPDMADFYGRNIFLAETSSTAGGLDSLLEPRGAIREAQDKASRAWGSKRSWFSTNGTSTSNKIVVQALTQPGDIVLIDRNCHKSHHYGLVLGGAHPLYLDAYPVEEFAVYGAVPLRTIKAQLLRLRREGRLDRVRLILLTNCTFDGIVYRPERVMEELLAIKPDLCFLWDEAWYAFATASPLTRTRTAMVSARRLQDRLRSDAYRAEYAAWRAEVGDLDPDDDAAWLDRRLLPDPDRARVRVYATQSTHKSLSALRQGSMIHAWDVDFERNTADAFGEAFLAHTSTSPNYQIIASLDLARRQVELEGYGMVNRATQMAMALREHLAADERLRRWFRVLDPVDLIPAEYRASGLARYGTVDGPGADMLALDEAVETDEFVLDPTRVTLELSATGLNGTEFRNDVLFGRFGLQINKTSINSVLFIVTIGATWSSLGYLLDALRSVADELEQRLGDAGLAERMLHERRVEKLRNDLPPLPDFSSFHRAFRPCAATPEGDMRGAFYLAYDEANRTYVPLEEARRRAEAGEELVSATFVVPYPPGFPVLVPGQVVSPEILAFMAGLDVTEIHGYRPELGFCVFTPEAVAGYAASTGRT